MIDPLILKLVHLLSAAVLFGTGLGIAFFFFWARRTGDAATIAAVSHIVVIADFVFTATAVVVQPLSGTALAIASGWRMTEPWLVATYVLYLLIGLCWLPVVVMQMRMARLARSAAAAGQALGGDFHRLYRWWFALGWPAFIALIAIYALMIWKPSF